MKYISKDYLPNTEERVARLRKIVNGRPVAILAAGPSINELEKRIGVLCNSDICYFGFNSFLQEKCILKKINKSFSVYVDGCPANMPYTINDIVDFLDRDEDNMFVSTCSDDTFGLIEGGFDVRKFLNKYDKKLTFFSVKEERTVPNSREPLHFIVSNTLLLVIQVAIIAKASRIFLFGADGGVKKGADKWYYRQNSLKSAETGEEAYVISPKSNLINDTNRYFNPIAPIALRNVYKTHNLTPIDILNSSKDSFYTPFPKISYDDAFEFLFTGKMFDKKSDLRDPKVSIISLCIDDEKALIRDTVQSVSRQSYANYEHIIISDGNADDAQDIVRQFANVKWIQKSNFEYTQTLKKGISSAKEEYVFFCGVGDGYLNRNWINTCVEILENDPDISLVWGLSQTMLDDGALGRISESHFFDNAPPQKKSFIYYWLKRKTIFPKENFCVRKKVLEECFSLEESEANEKNEIWYSFNYKFNTSGYLPYFVPIVANYTKKKVGFNSQRQEPSIFAQQQMDTYCEDIERYKIDLFGRKLIHKYRNASGELLGDGFNCWTYLFFDIGRRVEAEFKSIKTTLGRIKSKMPNRCVLVIDKVLFFWRVYRWRALNVGVGRLWSRIVKI